MAVLVFSCSAVILSGKDKEERCFGLYWRCCCCPSMRPHGRRPIQRGRCASSCRSPPAAPPTFTRASSARSSRKRSASLSSSRTALAGELFKAMAGVDIVHVPHKGSDQARTAILGKQVDMMFDAITTMAANARAGRVKALASSGKTRSPGTPDVPTLSEAGVPGYEATIWLGLMAPAGTPRPILEELNVELNN